MGRRETEKRQRIIGIIGTGRSVGVTHLSIMAAGYVSGVLRRSCAVLEWNSHEDFERIQKVCTCKIKAGSTNPFHVLDADYYRAAGTKELLLCKTKGYQDVIVDYGTVLEGNLEEFLRCDRRFVVGSVSEWQIGAFLGFAEGGKRADQRLDYFAVFGSGEARKNMEKRLGFPILRIPVSVDAWTVTSESLKFFEQIL